MQANSIIQGVLFICLMLGASYMDIRKRVIPPFICSLVALISVLDFRMIYLLGILSAFPLLVIAVWIAPNRLGGGDIKLVAATGLVLGLQATNIALIVGLTLQIFVFVTISFSQKMKKQEVRDLSLPLAPCLTFGFLVVYFMKLGGFIHAFI